MNVGLLLIHVIPGLLIAAHGSQKLFGPGRERAGATMGALGLAPGRRMAVAAGVNELVAGLLLAVGLFVPLAAALIGATYIVAARTAHAGRGPWNANGGWEYVLVLSTVAVGLAFNGAGTWSVDNAIGWDDSGLWWGIGAVVVALIGAAAVLGVTHRLARPSRGPLGPAGPVAGTRSP